MKNLLILFPALLLLAGCANAPATQGDEDKDTPQKNLEALQATVFHQTAAEMRALSYQAYNIARYRLDQSLRQAGLTKKQAIITDIDETVLDNSPHQARLIQEGASYPDYWAEWCMKAEAEPMPGALDFFNYASKKGVEVFYVSNRHDSLRAPTLKNLKKLGFPDADEDHLLLKTTTSGKTERRNAISENYYVVLLLGDNLNDFSDVFEQGSVAERFAAADKMSEMFGKRFIVFPNAMYGEWEGAALNYKWGAPAEQKTNMKLQQLTGFE
ncbi:MAG: 5'-nucleotidase, lipoprotein e(P4) family [Bacteroidales bacterium]|nr:5'-nucleotidase, lipoprotein e(P4) family [Bacteroidales bacterium]